MPLGSTKCTWKFIDTSLSEEIIHLLTTRLYHIDNPTKTTHTPIDVHRKVMGPRSQSSSSWCSVHSSTSTDIAWTFLATQSSFRHLILGLRSYFGLNITLSKSKGHSWKSHTHNDESLKHSDISSSSTTSARRWGLNVLTKVDTWWMKVESLELKGVKVGTKTVWSSNMKSFRNYNYHHGEKPEWIATVHCSVKVKQFRRFLDPTDQNELYHPPI